jgi:hypothetical protein
MSLSFEEYSRKIESVKLPIHRNCEEDLKGVDFDLNSEEIAKYGIKNSIIYGEIANEPAYTAILYLQSADVALPVLQTNNKKGEKISSLNLYEISCWEDDTISETSWFTINPDLSIVLEDSSATFLRNPDGDIITSTIESNVRKRVYKINDAGIILRD